MAVDISNRRNLENSPLAANFLHIPEASQAVVNNLLAFCIGAIAGLTFFHARDQGAALHGFGDLVTRQVEQRRSDIKEVCALILAAERIVGGCQQEHSKLRMVASVWAGIVLLHVKIGITNGANRPPIESCKVDNQIWSNIAHRVIKFFGLEDQRI